MKKYKNILIWLVAGFGLASCGSILSPQSQRATTMYQVVDKSFDSDTTPQCSAATINATLYLSPTRGASPYDSYKMYYSNDPYQMSQYAYSQWVTPVHELINQNIMKKLVVPCTFKSIVLSSAVSSANYHLITSLVTLRQEIDSSNKSQAHMIMGTELVDLSQNKVVGLFVFDQKVPTENTPHGYVEGVGTLMTQYDNKLVEWLKTQVKK